MSCRPRMDKVIRLKIDAFLLIVSSVHYTWYVQRDVLVRIMISEYLNVIMLLQETVCDDNSNSPSNNEKKI